MMLGMAGIDRIGEGGNRQAGAIVGVHVRHPSLGRGEVVRRPPSHASATPPGWQQKKRDTLLSI